MACFKLFPDIASASRALLSGIPILVICATREGTASSLPLALDLAPALDLALAATGCTSAGAGGSPPGEDPEDDAAALLDVVCGPPGPRLMIIFRTLSSLHLFIIDGTLPLTPFTSTILSPALIKLSG